MTPSVLIVIVNYRTTPLAIDCLRSIDREIRAGLSARAVVVDNLSGGDAVPRLQAAIAENGWSRWAAVLASDRNGGFAAGNNLAIRQELSGTSRAPYVQLLNPDTVVRPGAIEALAAFLDRHPEVGIAGSRIEDRQGRPQGSARRFPTPLGEFEAAARFGPITRLLWRHRISIPDVDEAIRCDWVSGAAMMIRSELFSTVGLFDEGYFLYFEETDYCRRAVSRGWQTWYVPASRVVHFEGSATGIRVASRRRPRYWFESRRRYFVKALGPQGLLWADCGWALGRLAWTVQKLSGLVACRDDDPRNFVGDLIGGDWRSVLSGRWRDILEPSGSGLPAPARAAASGPVGGGPAGDGDRVSVALEGPADGTLPGGSPSSAQPGSVGMSDPIPLRVAYLVNRYPAVSHTFIRREIAGIEAAGVDVYRFSIRATDDREVVDAADRAERERTTVLLAAGIPRLLAGLVGTAFTRPWRFLAALRAAWTLGGRSQGARLRHLAYLAEACLFRRLVRSRQIARVHAHFGTNPATVAYLARLLGGPPFSFTVHGPEEFDRPEALGLAEKIRAAEFVVAISEFGRSQLMRWTPAAEWRKLHVVRCGVDAAFLGAEAGDPPDRPRLVCVGRLCEDKGQMLLVEAAARLARTGLDFEIVLVGDGALRRELEAKIRAEGLERRVLLRGWMDSAGVLREVGEARALVLPSFAEGLPVVLMEALARGRPVISTQVAGIPELVRAGVNGWIVPPGSIEPLVDSLREALLAPRERLAELGRAGRAAVAERHDARKEAARLAQEFRRATESGAGP